MVNNIVADVVIDTGASASFLPKNGTVIRESRAVLTETKTDTRIADNGQLDCTHQTLSDVSVWAGTVQSCKNRFLVINGSRHILGYDALFGTDIIKQLRIEISSEGDSLIARIQGHTIGQEDTMDKYKKHLALVARLQKSSLPKSALDCLLNRYSDVFAESVTDGMKTRAMEIHLTSNEMPKSRLRRYSVEDVAEIDRQIQSMLERKVIEPSISSFSSTCHLVPKKTGQKRLVINFIPLNRIAVKDHYPLPQISDLLAHLAEAKYFCALDCTEGFWQVPVSREDRPKTAFVTPQGLFQFRRCPFGFTNSPAVFQRAMNQIFEHGLYKRCVIYIDDILVYGKTEEETLINLEWVLRRCSEFKVKLKMTKCEFLRTTVNFLGYRIGQGSIAPISEKCDPWKNFVPRNIKDAQAFLGYMNYYSRFIVNYSEKTKIIRLAIRAQPFEWNQECEEVKQKLLFELDSSTAQTIPRAMTPKQVELVVLDNSIEASCVTEDDQLIMRTSAILSSTQMNYSALEKELLALVRAYAKFGPFLKGPVTVKTSCAMLPSVLKLKDKPERVARLLLQLPPDISFHIKASNDVQDTIKRMIQPPDGIFYTDGAAKKNGDKESVASWAVVAVDRPELNCSGILMDSSNQKAEIEAVIKACEVAKANNLRNILVVTDSKYVANAINKWIDRWEHNGWLDNKSKPVKNMESFKRLAQSRSGLDLEIAHVRGHNGDRYNELADKLAREALLPHATACAGIHSAPTLQQDEDRSLKEIKTKLEEGEQVASYYLKDGVVWMNQNEEHKLVVPEKQRYLLLQLAHSDPIYGAHYGVKKTRAKLDHYYWPAMGTDISKYVQACETCQKNKTSRVKAYGKLMPIKTTSLFNRIHIDFIGPITPSNNGNKHIVTAIDAFSRMGFARACLSATAEEAIRLLQDEIISRHGPPEHIVSDNGTQFVSKAFKELVDDLGIMHSTVCEYNPKANGMDEKFNGTLFTIIKNSIDRDKKKWDILLPSSVLAYNLTVNESTKLSPYTIVYGRLPRGPLNPTEVEKDIDEIDHEGIRDVALANTEESQRRMSIQYDKNKQVFDLKPLDLVMVKTLSIGRTDSRKFASKWTGPHCIIRLLEHDGIEKAVEILDSDTFKVRRIAFGAIKAYHAPQEAPEVELPGKAISFHLGKAIYVSDKRLEGIEQSSMSQQKQSQIEGLNLPTQDLQQVQSHELRLQLGYEGVVPSSREDGQLQSHPDSERGVLPLTDGLENVHSTNTSGMRPKVPNPLCSDAHEAAEPRGSLAKDAEMSKESQHNTTNANAETDINESAPISTLESIILDSDNSPQPPTPSTLTCNSPNNH